MPGAPSKTALKSVDRLPRGAGKRRSSFARRWSTRRWSTHALSQRATITRTPRHTRPRPRRDHAHPCHKRSSHTHALCKVRPPAFPGIDDTLCCHPPSSLPVPSTARPRKLGARGGGLFGRTTKGWWTGRRLVFFENGTFSKDGSRQEWRRRRRRRGGERGSRARGRTPSRPVAPEQGARARAADGLGRAHALAPADQHPGL